MTDDCKKSFMEMKWKKVHRYVVYKIEEKSRKVTVDKVGAAGESYDDLAASLPEDDCRYAVFDFDYVTVDNCRMSKIFFITWLVSLLLSFRVHKLSDLPFFHPIILSSLTMIIKGYNGHFVRVRLPSCPWMS